MYAMLVANQNRVAWERVDHAGGDIARQPLSPADAQPLRMRATAIVSATFQQPGVDASNTTADRNRVALAVADLVPWLPDFDREPQATFEFRIRCAIAHHRLPQEARVAREARIACITDSMLPEAHWRRLLEPAWSALKKVGVLVPDTVLEQELRGSATNVVANACAAMVMPWDKSPLTPLLSLLSGQASVQGDDRALLTHVLATPYLTRLPAERAAFLAVVNQLLVTKRWPWIVEAHETIRREVHADSLCVMVLGDCLARMLSRLQDLKDSTLKDAALAYELACTIDALVVTGARVAQISIDAVLAGVPLGDSYASQVREVLANEQLGMSDSTQGLTMADLRGYLASAERPVAPEPQDRGASDPPDMDAIHTWSVGRLLTWIEGPVTQRPVNRRRIADKERERRTAVHNDPGAQRQTLPIDTDEDVDLVVNDALQTSAAFFRDDLDELLALAERLELPAPLLLACRQSRDAMSALSLRHQAMDDTHACALLAAAEGAIGQLRGQIKGARADEQQRVRFTNALLAAMQSEALVPGKRHGGIVACPMPLTSWAWVAQEFNGRWMPQARLQKGDGRPQPLHCNEALALYVTGSSRSQFAFDVSVHLWRRKPGSTGPASLDTDGLRQMNTHDWFDTWIPCAVLHVPPGR